MPTLSPAEWKRFYEAERKRMGPDAIDALLERAPVITVDARRGVIFPHTRLEVTGHMVAAAVRGVVESGADEVVALGVLHGAPSPERRIHVAGEPSTANEFSLDAFIAMLGHAGKRVRVHAFFPLHVGEQPETLGGVDEVARLVERMPVVATTDPVHHGVGYGDAKDAPRDAASAIEQQLRALERRDFATFQGVCRQARSDFRDVGPTLAHVLDAPSFDVLALDLVDYTEALRADPPTWVAGALIAVQRSELHP